MHHIAHQFLWYECIVLHDSFCLLASVRELFGNVMKALAEGLHTDWKRQTPMKHHHFAGDYHNFKGKHLPYQFYVQRYSEGPQCHIKMAPRLPHGTESEYESDKDESTDVDKALKGKPKVSNLQFEFEYCSRSLTSDH